MHVLFLLSTGSRHPGCALVSGVPTCALPICTEAPIFLISLAIGVQRLQIGANDRADPACLRGPGDLCRRGFALAQSLLEALERDGETYLAAMAEAVRNGLRHAEHLYRYSFNHMGFDAEIGRAHV